MKRVELTFLSVKTCQSKTKFDANHQPKTFKMLHGYYDTGSALEAVTGFTHSDFSDVLPLTTVDVVINYYNGVTNVERI